MSKSHLNQFPQIHERTIIAQQAELEFRGFLLDLIKKHSLTFGEVIGMLADRIAEDAKYMRRYERHPSKPNKRGDEA